VLLTKFYLDEIDRECGTYRQKSKAYKVLIGKLEEKRILR